MPLLYAFSLLGESPDNIATVLTVQLILNNDRCSIWIVPGEERYNRLCYIKKTGDYYWYHF